MGIQTIFKTSVKDDQLRKSDRTLQQEVTQGRYKDILSGRRSVRKTPSVIEGKDQKSLPFFYACYLVI